MQQTHLLQHPRGVLTLLDCAMLCPARARVVLPDPKLPGSDKDVIVWLDASFACASEEEAGQRGALAALQAVAGERSLEYVLPQVGACVCGVCVCVGGVAGILQRAESAWVDSRLPVQATQPPTIHHGAALYRCPLLAALPAAVGGSQAAGSRAGRESAAGSSSSGAGQGAPGCCPRSLLCSRPCRCCDV